MTAVDQWTQCVRFLLLPAAFLCRTVEGSVTRRLLREKKISNAYFPKRRREKMNGLVMTHALFHPVNRDETSNL
ncbi:hypothetical protein CHS0354_035859, partial [Potamilus streckersoni]